MSASSPAAGPTLWLLRHAPVLAAPGLCYGRTDLPADPAATHRAAESLALQLPRGTVVKTSPLQRCELLALDLQALRPDLAFKTDARLAEMDFGDWEGQPAAFAAGLPACGAAPPGEGGESVRALMARVGAAWDDWRASGADALWVTHAGVMRAALLLARGVRLPASAADWPADDLPFGEVLALQPTQ
mgnify:CR=1 FL=1